MSINHNGMNFFIKKENVGIRIDIFLREAVDIYTRSFIKNQIENKNIIVNGKSTKASYILKENDNIVMNINLGEKINLIPQNISLTVLYEDDELLVINKPKGMVVHPSKGHEDNTLVNGLLYKYKNNLSYVNEETVRPGIVHRLDKDTSGLLLVAKNNNAHLNLKKQIESFAIERIYNTIVFGNIKEKEFVVDTPIGRNVNDRRKQCVDFENGRESKTEFKVIKGFKSYTLVEAKLQTGRKHQIRVHLSSINYPILGDVVYGRRKQPFNTEGQILHSKSIGFKHPKTNEYIFIDSMLPNYFKRILDILNMKEL